MLSKLIESVVTCYATYCYVPYILLRSLFHICSGHLLCEVAVWTVIPAGYPRALEEPCTTLETIFLVCTCFLRNFKHTEQTRKIVAVLSVRLIDTNWHFDMSTDNGL